MSTNRRISNTKKQRSSMRAMNMQTTAAGQGGPGDRNSSVSIPYYSSNPETYSNPIERWRQYVMMYQTSWEARKIVNIPIDDALRKPFVLKGISDESAMKLKKKFDRLQLIPTLKRSLKMERLLGGCLTFMGLSANEDKPGAKYNPKIHKEMLHFINSIPVSRISRMNWDTNPLSENYMRPDSFFVNNVEVHVSRCLVWDGSPLFDPNDFALSNYRANLAGFGASVLGTLWDDIIMACGTRSAAYQLIQTNNAIIATINELQDIAGTDAGQKNIKKIQEIVQQLSVYRAAVVQGEKVDIKSNPASFGSVPELLLLYLQVLAAASDIPATRFLGQAPGGLNATGDSDLENYYNMIDSLQMERITPQLLRLCDVVGYSEIPTWDQERDKLEIEWPPLWNETAKEQAERASLTIDNVMKLLDGALMGDEQALEEINARGILSVKLEKSDLDLLGEARDAIDRHLSDTPDDGEEGTDPKKQIQRLKNMATGKWWYVKNPEGDWYREGPYTSKQTALAMNRQGGETESKRYDGVYMLQIDGRIIGSIVRDDKMKTMGYTNSISRPIESKIDSFTSLHGLKIAIENPKGSTRSGRDENLKTWSVVMPYDYGYVKRTNGADRDEVDVAIGPNPDSELVFIVDQVDLSTGAFDEHKCFLGCVSMKEATDLYIAGFSDGKGKQRIGGIYPMHMVQFMDWLKTGDTTKSYGMEG